MGCREKIVRKSRANDYYVLMKIVDLEPIIF
jgi:hypothetical protein